jgi:8-oxo-dGTP pyrophosphatase MutT (NUDIX family)
VSDATPMSSGTAQSATADDLTPRPGRGGLQRVPRPASARLGQRPPWASLVADGARLTMDHLVAATRRHQAVVPAALEGSRTSAVLLGLVVTHDGPAVILTKRAAAMRQHSGELSFPGGRVDHGESLIAAAIRETNEEIGTSPHRIDVVGELDALTTVVSSALIHPIVATVDLCDGVVANPAEVERVLVVPVSELVTPGVYRQEIWGFGGVERSVHFFELEGETLWGATARVVTQLLTLGTNFALEVDQAMPMDDG